MHVSIFFSPLRIPAINFLASCRCLDRAIRSNQCFAKTHPTVQCCLNDFKRSVVSTPARAGRYVTLLDIPSLDTALTLLGLITADFKMRNKISLFQGDITRLEVDAIVNAANPSLLGGRGGIDEAIHTAAGVRLREECVPLYGGSTGCTKVTSGCRLPAHYVLHAVCPRDGDAEKLRNCYRTLLEHVVTSHDQHGQHQTLGNSIGTTSSFPLLCRAAIPPSADYSCVSPAAANYPTTFRYHRSIRTLAIYAIAVGLYGFPVEEATHVALGTVREWLNDHHSLVDRIVFVVFDEEVKVVYEQLFDAYF